jgi:hypothetical protein
VRASGTPFVAAVDGRNPMDSSRPIGGDISQTPRLVHEADILVDETLTARYAGTRSAAY